MSFPTRINGSIPTDEEGYIGRECRIGSCEGYFKIKPGTGLTGKDLPCHCPYCGHIGSPKEFFTKDQIEFAKSVAFRQMVGAFRAELKKMEFDIKPPPGSFGIGISMKLKPGAPIPLKRYRERTLETNVCCSNCTLDYAVYGVFAFCPDCGTHNSFQILEKNIALVRKQLSLAETQTDEDFKRHLIEGALENCVSSFDGFAREACRVAARRTDSGQCVNLSFQNLRRAAKGLASFLKLDLTKSVSLAEWNAGHISFMRRHVLAHRGGVIDQQYLDETGETRNLLGRRVTVTPADVEHLAGTILKIGRWLLDNLSTLIRA